MTGPAYSAARAVSATIQAYFARRLAEAGRPELVPQPDAREIEAIIDAAFWASLRREEGYSPKISLAFLPPGQAGNSLTFERLLPLTPATLSRLAPAAERPGIHLGVWRESGELAVWGTTRSIPALCFVVEVIASGLIVIKHRSEAFGKFVNVAVLEGDQIKIVDEGFSARPECPGPLKSLLGVEAPRGHAGSVDVLVQLAASMRSHNRGGTLLVVPAQNRTWRESIVEPMLYSVSPPYTDLA